MDDFQAVIKGLLGREEVPADTRVIRNHTRNTAVLVSGAGGSIGQELCRQLVKYQPAKIILFERSEFALYAIETELRELASLQDNAQCIDIVPVLGSIRNRALVEKVIKRFRVDTIYHAAAYKQVPMLERNVIAGIQNNIFGTLVMAKAAEKLRVKHFIHISTDKAVRPVNVMGATKRFGEQILQSLNARGSRTCFSMVRFGNVLGSSGSVLPLFRKQILNGGPVTVTHPEVTRYFMTAEEAALLVIQAGALARGGEVFVLDMQVPLRIADVARKMIELMGYRVCDSCEQGKCDCRAGVSIKYTGLRQGEKLFEELLIGKTVAGTAHPKIMRAVEAFLDWQALQSLLERLEVGCTSMRQDIIRDALDEAIEGFRDRVVLQDQVAIPDSEESIEP
ncbi:MAG: SDR family NAD(P)-dependent oxidoreductase, partial [Gammaproteobacteria bacterium]